MHVEKNGSDDISGGNQIGLDTFQNGSDIIRYPTAILSPAYKESTEELKIRQVYYRTWGVKSIAAILLVYQ